jgi:hypothetical protein
MFSLFEWYRTSPLIHTYIHTSPPPPPPPQAKEAILEMKGCVDTLIVVSNDKLLEIVPENTPLTDAFLVADDILRQGVVGISEIIIKPGLVNVDFADVRSIMGNAGDLSVPVVSPCMYVCMYVLAVGRFVPM